MSPSIWILAKQVLRNIPLLEERRWTDTFSGIVTIGADSHDLSNALPSKFSPVAFHNIICQTVGQYSRKCLFKRSGFTSSTLKPFFFHTIKRRKAECLHPANTRLFSL